MYRELECGVPGAVAWSVVSPAPDAEAFVLPDGCMDLIWHERGFVVAGPDTVAHRTSAAGPRAIGLRFAPGLGPRVFGVSADALRDTRLSLDELWPAAVVRRLSDAAEVDPLRAIADEARRRLEGVGRPVETEIAAYLAAGASVSAAATMLGWSDRRLHRKSLSAFGYGPKTLSRVLRFDRALSAARTGTPFARVAAETGYADQAHLAREVRALAGVSLSALVGQPGSAAKRSTVLPSGSFSVA
ncbi:helix-turn-helix domain-containing protein [Rhodococcus spelaei]|uniref:Helix-turn-helix domain-containing protein n=1 Tax=Rhodococcus spelaei TaxID=2546320 RepID=A0A541BRP1_9NOCA|nr:helix-turn-helix domain-containing protein [Rhodococcus spelaei]TQF74990.1 helix-turn-helix domain-containing protein [Rhodococcus spelaei]